MLLLIPGTEPSAPTVKSKPPPEVYTRRLAGPREGSELFRTLLKTATDIFELVSKAGRNVVSMATPLTVLAEQGECKVDKLKLLGIDVKDVGGQYILETNRIVDTAADISCTTNEVMAVIQELEVSTRERRRTSYEL